MNIFKTMIKHIKESVFVTATGLSALPHSTWTLATLMSGEQPKDPIQFIFWVLPAFLIATALDIGQISTSHAIRKHGLTWSRGLTFSFMAIATYYSQFLYMVHHVPAVQLSAGVRNEWLFLVALFRDACIWIVPALLPLSTVLYTMSGGDTEPEPTPEKAEEPLQNSIVISLPEVEEMPLFLDMWTRPTTQEQQAGETATPLERDASEELFFRDPMKALNIKELADPEPIQRTRKNKKPIEPEKE